MDHVALRLSGAPDWTYVGGLLVEEGGKPKKALEVVLRAFDRAVEFAVGESESAPSSASIRVPAGEGRRLTGMHFFVRPANAGPACRISYRGV